MKTRWHVITLFIGLGVCLGLGSCEAPDSQVLETVAVQKNQQADLLAQKSQSASYQYKIGAPFFGPPDFPPVVVAEASNGDIIEVAGEGTLSVHPKSVTGNGTFTHKDAGGNVVGSGSWTATQLLSFIEYGPSTDPGFPPSFRAGYAHIRLQLSAGGTSFGGILKVFCLLPGVKAPPSSPEGIYLNIQGGLNFNKVAGGGAFGGPTLFILE